MTRFFFYGTLIAGSGNAVARTLHRKLGKGRPATARGRLYAIPDVQGWYPAFLPDSADGLVRGFVHETKADWGPADLAVIDRYEGADYERRAVTLEGGAEAAEAYAWVGSLPAGALVLAHGSFRRFLAETGCAAFGTPG